MSHRLPPLNGLRAFEVTGRHLSFTHAANELYLTRGAVAQQVRKLEASLGERLVAVRRNRLMLTAAGERYLARITAAFRSISDATEEIAPALKGRVFRLGIAPELAGRASKLVELLRRPPAGLRLRLVRDHDVAALRENLADAVLRPGERNYPGFNAERVSLRHLGISAEARLVAQPGLAGCREHRMLFSLLRTDVRDPSAADRLRSAKARRVI
jgi:LysR family glycine cleavage system transcriptional activator